MDILTLVGIVSGMGLIVGAIMMKTSISVFIDPGSLMIVFGGTFASTCISYSGKSIGVALKDMITVFSKHNIVYMETIKEILMLSQKARKESLLAIEKVKVSSPFMQKGINYLVSGLKPASIEKIMNIEKFAERDRELESGDVLEKMGDLAPAWGMVGTLIGLVIMMLNLDDPSAIGPSMAVALLTTFYGAVLANLIFMPCSTKLITRSDKSLKHHDIIIAGIIAIANDENPRMIKDKLAGFLAGGDGADDDDGKK